MGSVLSEYANSYLLIDSGGVPSIIDGRISSGSGDKYLVECYLKREERREGEYIGSRSGSSRFALDGASGNIYFYEGYALRYGRVSSNYEIEGLNLSGIVWNELGEGIVPRWIRSGVSGKHRQGVEKAGVFTIEVASGRYGNEGIDKIINKEIGGIRIRIRTGQVLN
jgi:hypothetical protein